MALIKCRECGHEISKQARTCPRCGAINRRPRRGFFGQLVLLLFIAFNLLMLFALGSAFIEVGQVMETGSETQKADVVIGTTIGVGLLLGIWALGDIILGLLVLLTRPS